MEIGFLVIQNGSSTLMGRDLMKNNNLTVTQPESWNDDKNTSAKTLITHHKKDKTFSEQQLVYVQSHVNPKKMELIPAEVTQLLSSHHYLCVVLSGREEKFNVDQMTGRYKTSSRNENSKASGYLGQTFKKPKREG